MYEFAILLLGGALVLKTVDLFGGLSPKELGRGMTVLTSAIVGVVYAFLFDYSVFAAWGIDVRSATIGLVATGLFMSALADVWREMLALFHDWAHRYQGQASGTEARLGRAA
ncbi:MAG TPA: hypothetical protein VM840_12445 [Actinomycetota bacterium]|nr:hypothetical protein [Actinomycetota bacterium]